MRQRSTIQQAAAGIAAGAALFLAGCAAPTSVTVLAGGDCMFGRSNSAQGTAGAVRWQGIADAARSSTVFLFNLETTVGTGGTPRRAAYVFRAPPSALEALRAFPAVIAGMANNHTMDFGASGLQGTLDSLDAAHIRHAGAGRDRAAAYEPAELSVGRAVVRVLSAGVDNDPTSFASATRAGIAALDLSSLRNAISAARGPRTVVVVMLHWGVEYDTAIAPAERSLAHALVEAGADLVIGTGPHVLRGVESWRGALICYSLGNLLFDDLESAETSAGMLVKMTVTDSWRGARKRFFLAPLRTTSVAEGPRAPSPQEAAAIVRSVAERSPDPRIVGPPASGEDGLRWWELRAGSTL